jgi:hypothetical protein
MLPSLVAASKGRPADTAPPDHADYFDASSHAILSKCRAFERRVVEQTISKIYPMLSGRAAVLSSLLLRLACGGPAAGPIARPDGPQLPTHSIAQAVPDGSIHDLHVNPQGADPDGEREVEVLDDNGGVMYTYVKGDTRSAMTV